MSKLQPLTIDQCLSRLRQAKAEAEEKQSLEPIRKLFSNLTDYARRHNPDKIALQNWARTYSLWQSHFEAWYIKFKEGKE